MCSVRYERRPFLTPFPVKTELPHSHNYLKKRFDVSKFGLVSVLFFLVFGVIRTLLLPFGDEPDYATRVHRLNFDEKPVFSPYRYVDFYRGIPEEHDCRIQAGPLNIWAKFSPECFYLNIEYFWPKFSHLLLLTSPLILLVVFRRRFFQADNAKRQADSFDWHRRMDALALFLLMPSAIYFLGLISQEVFVVVLSLLVFVFWRKPLVLIALSVAIFLLDEGNFYALALFLTMYTLLRIAQKNFGLKGAYVLSLIAIVSAYIGGEWIIRELSQLNIVHKFYEVYDKVLEISAYDNYPLFLRPFVTYISLLFASANGVKSVFVYIIISASIGVVLVKFALSKRRNFLVESAGTLSERCNSERDTVAAITVVVTIICIAFFYRRMFMENTTCS